MNLGLLGGLLLALAASASFDQAATEPPPGVTVITVEIGETSPEPSDPAAPTPPGTMPATGMESRPALGLALGAVAAGALLVGAARSPRIRRRARG